MHISPSTASHAEDTGSNPVGTIEFEGEMVTGEVNFEVNLLRNPIQAARQTLPNRCESNPDIDLSYLVKCVSRTFEQQ